MKLRWIAAITVLLSLGTGGHRAIARPFASLPLSVRYLAQSQWQQLTSDAGKFAIQMPGSPRTETVLEEISGEQVDLHQFGVQPNEESVFVIMYADLPQAYTEGNTEQVFDRIGNDLFGTQFQQLKEKQQPISLDGNPGREFRVAESDNTFVMRMYLVGQRSYLLLSQSKQANEIEQFLDSFQLL